MSKYQIVEVTRKSGEVEYRLEFKELYLGIKAVGSFPTLQDAKDYLKKIEGWGVVSERIVE